MVAVGNVLFMVIITLAVPVRPLLSVAVRVTIWVPLWRLFCVNVFPVPIVPPVRLDVQTRFVPGSVPSSVSVPVPLNTMTWPLE